MLIISTSALRRLVDSGKIDEIDPEHRRILRLANEQALLDLSIALMRAEDPPAGEDQTGLAPSRLLH